ncbi:unnamed protein product [Lactuca saligna]|uniref:Transposase (putative) gypsy type domain-containing protein n=1 Tax=Lactuca saligna TaxID=75948 RepID=A0AA36ECB1_LACSI|nr:unnamed protein product [Lactuca saligna]
MYRHGRVPTVEEFQLLQDHFGFLPKHGVMIPKRGVSIYDCPQEKVGVPIPLFKVRLRVPTSNFFNMIVDHYGFSVDELTSSAINSIVGFELVCRSLGCIPTFWVFSFYFCSTTNSSVLTLSKRWGIHQLISEQDIPKKNWQRKWLWVNRDLVGRGFIKTREFLDHIPKFFGSNLTLDMRLGNNNVVGKNWEDSILVAVGMSATWKKGERTTLSYESLYSTFIFICVEAEILLEMALRGHYWGENASSSELALPSQPAIEVVSLAHPLISAPSGLPVGVQVGRVTTLVRKRQSLRVVPLSNEETKFHDVGLHPRKVHRTVSMARLLGSIRDFLGNNFESSVQKDKAVIPDFATSPPLSFTTTFPIDLSSDSTFGSALGSPGDNGVDEI